jgi:hypothetical protein
MKFDWNRLFRETPDKWSISIQNRDPTPSSEPKSGRRNIFKEDEKDIMAAARKYGYVISSAGKQR